MLFSAPAAIILAALIIVVKNMSVDVVSDAFVLVEFELLMWIELGTEGWKWSVYVAWVWVEWTECFDWLKMDCTNHVPPFRISANHTSRQAFEYFINEEIY